MAATTIGEIQLIAKIDTSQYKLGTDEINRANKSIEDSASRTEKSANNSFSGISKVGLAAIVTASVAAGAAITKNIGNAVRRVDTLNNFPNVMQNLGYGADEAERAINTLDKGVRGLPTSLDQISSSLQNIAPATADLDSATQLTLAFNNALVASGKTTDQQAMAMEQFSQAIAKGKPDMMEWRTLASTMPGQLKQISNSLGYENWQKMAEAVTEGDISINDVMSSIVKLNNEGINGLPSFAEQAKNATGGIRTSFTLMNTAITRGIGGISKSIGRENISNALMTIGRAFEAVFGIISAGIGFMRNNANIFLPIINGIGAFIGALFGLASAAYVGVKAFAALRAAMTLLAAHPVVFTLSVIAGLIAAIATHAGMKDITKGLDDASESSKDTKSNLGGVADNLSKSGKEAEKLAKELAKIDKQIAKTNEDFREQLAELVFNKRESIAQLTAQLKEEDSQYKKSYSDRLHEFNKSQTEEALKHQEKTQALQTQIDFLSRYNTAANRRRLSELQFTLARENSEFDKRNQERQIKYDQDQEAERLSYEARQAELQTRLNNETALLEKHRTDVDSIRNVMLLDEIDKLKRSRNEQLNNLAQQRNDAISNAASTANAVAAQWTAPDLKSKFDNAGAGLGEELGKGMIRGIINEIKNLPRRIWEATKSGSSVDKMFESLFGPNSLISKSLFKALTFGFGGSYSTGGFTGAGGINEPAGIVHKGEYVLPQNMVNQSTGLPDLDKLISSSNSSGQSSTSVTVSLRHSKGAMRQAALDTIDLVNEVYRSKGMPQIGVKH